MSTLATIKTAVDLLIQDDASFLDATDINSLIQNQAASHYTRHKPYLRKNDITGDGTYDYVIDNTNFPSWSDGFSEIKKVYYPAGEYQDPEDARIPREEFTIYETSSARYLRFTRTTPSGGKTIRVFYIAPHSVPDSGNTTIYDADLGPFYNLAGSYCCFAIANKMAQSSESTIGADAVAYRNKSDVFAARAKNLMKAYMDVMFPEVTAAIAFREFDTIYRELGYTRLTHPEWAG